MRSKSGALRTGFMDRVDFEFEVGSALGGNSIYPSVEDLRKHHPCVRNCGVVEVEILLKRLVKVGLDNRRTRNKKVKP